jgi:hypothetical protein
LWHGGLGLWLYHLSLCLGVIFLLLYEFVLQRLVQHQPTQYPTSEELSIGKIKFKAFDLGGHQIARRVWKDYYAQVCLSLFLKYACVALIKKREAFVASVAQVGEYLKLIVKNWMPLGLNLVILSPVLLFNFILFPWLDLLICFYHLAI